MRHWRGVDSYGTLKKIFFWGGGGGEQGSVHLFWSGLPTLFLPVSTAKLQGKAWSYIILTKKGTHHVLWSTIYWSSWKSSWISCLSHMFLLIWWLWLQIKCLKLAGLQNHQLNSQEMFSSVGELVERHAMLQHHHIFKTQFSCPIKSFLNKFNSAICIDQWLLQGDFTPGIMRALNIPFAIRPSY